MRRDTRLDGLPLVTVVALCTLLLTWMVRGGKPTQARAGEFDWLAAQAAPEHARASLPAEPPAMPWGGRTPGELLERVLDPASSRVRLDPTEPDSTWPPRPDPPVSEPFLLSGRGGVALVEGGLVEGRPDGPWVFRHATGELRARGVFRVGAPEGDWEAWHENGAPRTRLSYEEGAARGLRTDWWPSGGKLLEGRYQEGQREGLWHTWHENGTLRSEGRYHAGLREGAWREWHANGVQAALGSYAGGRREGLYRAWYPDGSLAQEGRYLEGRREGPWAFFERDGRRGRRSGVYLAGQLQRH